MRSPNRLLFHRGFDLWLHNDDDRGRLDIQAGAACLDLRYEDAGAWSGGEAVYNVLPGQRGNGAVDRTECIWHAYHNTVDDRSKEREHEHFAAICARLLDNGVQTVEFRAVRTIVAHDDGATHAHEVTSPNFFHIRCPLTVADGQPFIGLNQVWKLREHILLVTAQVDRSNFRAKTGWGHDGRCSKRERPEASDLGL